jgi:hypothetical protein
MKSSTMAFVLLGFNEAALLDQQVGQSAERNAADPVENTSATV